MRIAILLPGNVGRSGELSGYNIRYGGTGSSGTESSIIYVAEYLVQQGYEVVISSEKCDNPIIDRGVRYTDFTFKSIDHKEFDTLISCLWFKDYDSLPIKVNKSIIYWYHLAWGYSVNEIKEFAIKNNLRISAVSVSNWAKKFNDDFNIVLDFNKSLVTSIIPNPVAVDLVEETLKSNFQKKKRKVIFHAQWSRGGDVAKKACDNMGWTNLDFKSFDYVNDKKGVDKKTLFKEIYDSEYFIFPQLTHGKLVYKDTFSLSVAEAIALGVTVITYPLGALPEYFGDYCEFLDFPPGSNIASLNKDRVSEDPSLNYTLNIEQKLRFFDDNPDLLIEKRKLGIDYIRNNFSINKIGPMWIDLLKKLQ